MPINPSVNRRLRRIAPDANSVPRFCGNTIAPPGWYKMGQKFTTFRGIVAAWPCCLEWRPFLSGLLVGRFRKQDFKHQQPRTDHNGAIGNVEGRPLVLPDVEKQEVHDVSADHAAPEID